MIPNLSLHTINGTQFPPISQYAVAIVGANVYGERQQFLGADDESTDTVRILTRPYEYMRELTPTGDQQEIYAENDMIICAPRILAENDIQHLHNWISDCKQSNFSKVHIKVKKDCKYTSNVSKEFKYTQ